MEESVVISVEGTQRMVGEEKQTVQIVTDGTMKREGDMVYLSYEESEMTGMEGTTTTFELRGPQVRLIRTGKVNSVMDFAPGRVDESLYEAGPGALMLRVQTKNLTVLMNEHGGIFDLAYTIEVEYATCGLNSYHIEIRTT